MEKYFNVLKKTGLFDDVNKEDMMGMLKCLGYHTKNYKKDSFIMLEGDIINSIGIILSGSAQVIKEDITGNKNIIAELTSGDLFSETLVCAAVKFSPVSVLATNDCEIMYIGFKNMITTCSSSCGFHTQLIKNMLKIISQKAILLNAKMDILSQRSTKEKLMTYFLNQAKSSNNKKFYIPYSRKELADYLCVDRSALSRELSKLQQDGVIKFNKNKFELL